MQINISKTFVSISTQPTPPQPNPLPLLYRMRHKTIGRRRRRGWRWGCVSVCVRVWMHKRFLCVCHKFTAMPWNLATSHAPTSTRGNSTWLWVSFLSPCLSLPAPSPLSSYFSFSAPSLSTYETVIQILRIRHVRPSDNKVAPDHIVCMRVTECVLECVQLSVCVCVCVGKRSKVNANCHIYWTCRAAARQQP